MEPPKKLQQDDANPPPQDDQRVAALESQLAKMTDLAARAQADLQNAKTRMQRDAEEIRKYAAQSVLEALLPVLDNFQRAFKHLPKDLAGHEWVKGMTALEGELWKKLSELGLRKVESLGQQVDTAKHEVVTLGPGKEGDIVEVLEEGYELNGRLLRPARVKVGDGQKAA
jgi:molecular chaperone GrpE